MTVSTVLQRGLGEQRIYIRDLIDGEEDIVRNPDGLCVVAESVSVCVNVHVGVLVVVIVTVTVAVRTYRVIKIRFTVFSPCTSTLPKYLLYATLLPYIPPQTHFRLSGQCEVRHTIATTAATVISICLQTMMLSIESL